MSSQAQEWSSQESPVKPSTGSSPLPMPNSCPGSPLLAATLSDNSNSATEDSCTGNWSPASTRKLLWPKSERPLDPRMPNPLDQTQPGHTYKKKKHGWPAHPSNSVPFQSGAIPPLIGLPFRTPPVPEPSMISRLISMYVVTTNCGEFAQITYNRVRWNEAVMSFGAGLKLERADAHGMKPLWRLSVKIHAPSGGMDTWVNNMLSSMNSGGPLTSATSCDGWIVTRYAWKSKVEHCHCAQRHSGLPATWIPACGTPNWTEAL